MELELLEFDHDSDDAASGGVGPALDNDIDEVVKSVKQKYLTPSSQMKPGYPENVKSPRDRVKKVFHWRSSSMPYFEDRKKRTRIGSWYPLRLKFSLIPISVLINLLILYMQLQCTVLAHWEQKKAGKCRDDSTDSSRKG